MPILLKMPQTLTGVGGGGGGGREAGEACQPVKLLGMYFCLCIFESYMLKINNHYSKR